MKYSIIIPMYNNFDGVNQRLWEIHDLCITYSGEYEIIICDDASPKESVEEIEKKMEWWKKKVFSVESLQYFRNKLNHGFGGNCNLGFERAVGDIVFFVSSDVKVHRDFITPTSQFLEEEGVEKLVGGRLLNFDTGWNVIDGKVFPYLEGWFLACKSSVFQKLGGFDTRFGKFDYEDVDLSTTAVQKGMVLEPLASELFTHYSGQSIVSKISSEERKAITEKNRLIFQEKWK